MKEKHTELPWKVTWIFGNVHVVGREDMWATQCRTKENAEFIVRACNCIGPHLEKLDELIRKTGLSEADLIGQLLVAEVNRLATEDECAALSRAGA